MSLNREQPMRPFLDELADAFEAYEVPAGSIGTNELADGAVTNAKIANGAVNMDKLASDVQIPQPTDAQVTSAVNAALAAHPEWTTTVQDGSITGVKIADDTIPDAKLAQTGGVLSRVSNLIEGIGTTVTSKNRYNGVYEPDKFVSQADGKLYSNTTYSASDFLDVSSYDSVVISTITSSVALRYALYTTKSDTTFISGDIPTPTLSTIVARYYYVIDTSEANYLRFSATKATIVDNVGAYMVEKGSEPSPYTAYYDDYYELKNMGEVESAVFGNALTSVSKELADGEYLTVESNSIRKSNQIVFFGKFSQFNRVYVGHGETGSNTEFVVVDDTNVYFATNGTVPDSGIAHGLTISTYIGIVIDVSSDCIATFTIYTLGGSYTRTLPTTSPWIGVSGSIFAKSVGSVFTDAHLTWNADYQKSKWFFGDSYMTNYSQSRWPYYMQKGGYDNALINAFPGQGSRTAYSNWLTALTHGKPKYALWALGMNDPDDTAINPTWKSVVDSFLEDCDNYGITPILATIPNTPSLDHTYKNAYIKSLPYRYIDFAEAVGATEAGSSWYAGCLASDNVHPTENGAKLLYLRALIDFPELMQE